MIKSFLRWRLFKTLALLLICNNLGVTAPYDTLAQEDADNLMNARTFFDKGEISSSILEKCSPCVVRIRNESIIDPSLKHFFSSKNPYDLWDFPSSIWNNICSSFNYLYLFFLSPPPQENVGVEYEVRWGSGFFVSSDGYIMTNAHIVRCADKLTISYKDGRELDATLVGSDPQTNIAILKVEDKNFPYLELADSDKIEVGEEVAAIGAPFQDSLTLSAGILKDKGKQNLHITAFEDFIQTDAVIYPGNSGGPLVNIDCQAIGINTAILTIGLDDYKGISFAIPSNIAKKAMNQIIEKEFVERTFLGMDLLPIHKDIADILELDKVEGALVLQVTKDSPADKAGIQQGDIILESNGVPIKSIGRFLYEIFLMDPNTILQLKTNRNGSTFVLPVTLESSSDNLASPSGIVQNLGVEIKPLTQGLRNQLGFSKGNEGLVITKVKPGSPAAQAGLQPGSLILAVNHKTISSINEFNKAMNDPDNPKRIFILVKHGPKTSFYSIKLS